METKEIVSIHLARALQILPIVDKYMLAFLYVFGVIGSFLNIFTLIQKKFRKNSCSLYFLCASMTDFLIMNIVLIPDLLRYVNPSLFVNMNSNIFWCKFGKYFVFLLPCLSSTLITLSSIDRFCTSSKRIQFRRLSQLKVSRVIIPVLIFIWILFSLHIIILYDVVQMENCRGPTHLFLFILIVDGYFFSLFNGAIVPFLLLIFGFLIYRNVRTSRQRLAPRPIGTNLHLITMVLVQSSLTVVLNVPYVILYLYGLYNNVPIDILLRLVYVIFVYIARWFWFLNYVKTFYLNSLSSQIFRNTLKQRFFSFLS